MALAIPDLRLQLAWPCQVVYTLKHDVRHLLIIHFLRWWNYACFNMTMVTVTYSYRIVYNYEIMNIFIFCRCFQTRCLQSKPKTYLSLQSSIIPVVLSQGVLGWTLMKITFFIINKSLIFTHLPEWGVGCCVEVSLTSSWTTTSSGKYYYRSFQYKHLTQCLHNPTIYPVHSSHHCWNNVMEAWWKSTAASQNISNIKCQY